MLTTAMRVNAEKFSLLKKAALSQIAAPSPPSPKTIIHRATQRPGTTADVTSAHTGQHPSTRRVAPGWWLREMLCAGQRPQGSLQSHSGFLQVTTRCQSKALLTLRGEIGACRASACTRSQAGVQARGRREERCRPPRGLGRRHRPHPSTRAGCESVCAATNIKRGNLGLPCGATTQGPCKQLLEPRLQWLPNWRRERLSIQRSAQAVGLCGRLKELMSQTSWRLEALFAWRRQVGEHTGWGRARAGAGRAGRGERIGGCAVPGSAGPYDVWPEITQS